MNPAADKQKSIFFFTNINTIAAGGRILKVHYLQCSAKSLDNWIINLNRKSNLDCFDLSDFKSFGGDL